MSNDQTDTNNANRHMGPNDGATAEPISEEELIRAEADAHFGESNNIIKNHVIAAMAVGMVPVPVIDIVGLIGLQIKMVHNLAYHYDIEFSQNLVKSLVVSLIGGALPVATVAAASLLKSVPGIGTIAGVASVSVLSGAITYAVGRVFMQHFESGGTLINFNPTQMRQHFKDEMEQGKLVATSLKHKEDQKE
ncbi:MAG: YcjF family protein [Candidatus Competibacterales bacterium]